MNKQALLAIKQAMKKRMPSFARQDSHKQIKLSEAWRRPKGIHSKMREHRKGHPVCVTVGYRTPVELRSANRAGLLPIRVATLKELQALHPQKEYAIVARTLGLKKRLQLLHVAREKGIPVHIPHVDQYVKRLESQLQERRKARENALKQHAPAKKVAEATKQIRKDEPPQKKEQELTDAEKEERARREQEKLLTKRV